MRPADDARVVLVTTARMARWLDANALPHAGRWIGGVPMVRQTQLAYSILDGMEAAARAEASGRWQGRLHLPDRYLGLLTRVADDPVDGFDLHNDGDEIVDLLRELADQVVVGQDGRMES